MLMNEPVAPMPEPLSPQAEPPPPLLGSWNRVYAVVVGELVLLVLLFLIFTWAFA